MNKFVIMTTNWLWRELILHFGKPRYLQIDLCKSQGESANLCDILGIAIRTTSAGYAYSNG